MKNKRNVWLLPTDEPSNITIRKRTGELVYDAEPFTHDEYDVISNQNIYITSDEEIKEGDWLYVKTPNIYGGNVIAKSLGNSNGCWADYILTETTDEKGYHPSHCKKIILTDNKDLIKDGVQAIDDEFLKWFVKNPNCEFVKVENQYRVKSGTIQEHIDGIAGYEYYEYKIIIPKEEPNPLTVGKEFYESADKNITVYKQETLEEVAEKYAEHQLTGIDDKFSKFECINDFIAGAKWQQEQDKNKYNEEDMIEFAVWTYLEVGQNSGKERTNKELFKEWYEQFKKK
jgi:hypothetical protein